jgi:hypothetical protein
MSGVADIQRQTEGATMSEDTEAKVLSNVVRIDEDQIRDHLGKIVRGSVEETLNALLDAEADRLCNAARYERRRRVATRGRGPMSAACTRGRARFA